ncbi:hypothetical protein M5K25_000429 [Dendrobium thyrsiflorum]|uniref:Uncharacterized protein n=1 Tax=Dendrobium thyrsiflorum TaxID=117978 RepID=A0ABD0VTL2_DENTH
MRELLNKLKNKETGEGRVEMQQDSAGAILDRELVPCSRQGQVCGITHRSTSVGVQLERSTREAVARGRQ